jgi:hypothetical protein
METLPSRITVHKFEKFVDYGLEEFPVGAQKSRILSDDVHYIRCYYGLVVFTPFLLA